MSPPQELSGSSKPEEPLLATKEAAVKTQQAPPPLPDTVTPDEEDIDQFLDEFDSGVQNVVIADEAKNRERKRLEQEVNDKEDELNAIKNAPKPDTTYEVFDDNDEPETLGDEVVAEAELASAKMADLVQAKKELTEEVAAEKAKIAEMEETEKSLRSELKKTKEDKEDAEKNLAVTKKKLLDQIEKFTTLQHERNAMEKAFKEYVLGSKRKISGLMDRLKTTKDILARMNRP
ncbi:predicted protein [Chaetomium globosum CBS 148.51]|uniref:Uncharacterized protein n=1 Tax=Chaetomium globosum (strain ATCC 6205 / CBS 148.51 / DSM 1962 / NBRC 6347 / NRRL 1970) TaxID=306901 RepID=Q2GX98_CHAGB|nr:uncharacterized protein CHGG_07406 [Chaetomium globosum CBS 148.51]EAQ86153.1 predicted protein [Chaetomium globosum CBS 148.51]